MKLKLEHYHLPPTKKLIQIATFIKGLTATIAGSALISGHQTAAVIIMITGAVSDELIKFLKEDEVK